MVQFDALSFFESHWGDLASVVGFVITIVTLLRTKSAAEAAKNAVVQLRERLIRVNTVGDFAAVLEIIDEIKRLHRVGAWEILLDRYSIVRRRLVSIQGSETGMTADQAAVIASAIEQFRTMEQTVERAWSKDAQNDLDLARLNKVAAKTLDDLNSVMISIRQAAD